MASDGLSMSRNGRYEGLFMLIQACATFISWLRNPTRVKGTLSLFPHHYFSRVFIVNITTPVWTATHLLFPSRNNQFIFKSQRNFV
jgi:hypothetical protein